MWISYLINIPIFNYTFSLVLQIFCFTNRILCLLGIFWVTKWSVCKLITSVFGFTTRINQYCSWELQVLEKNKGHRVANVIARTYMMHWTKVMDCFIVDKIYFVLMLVYNNKSYLFSIMIGESNNYNYNLQKNSDNNRDLT